MQDVFNIEDGVLVSFTGEEHNVTVPAGVRVIGREVFKGMSWITDIALPEGLVEIGDNAFKGCRKLERINFPGSLERIGELAFHRCHSLVSAVLPDSVTVLGKGTFLCCDSLRRIKAYGVKSLGMQTFANDTRLAEIALNSEIDTSNFRNDIFTGCIGIKDIALSDGFEYHEDDLIDVLISGKAVHPVVRAVAESVYQSLEIESGTLRRLHVNLRSIDIPEGIRCIDKGCFFDKKGIVSISLPSSLECIRANAFGNCISLERIYLKNEEMIAEDGAFRGCSNLKEVVIGSRTYRIGGICYEEGTPHIIRQIGYQAMSDFYISGRTLMSYTGSEERVTIPDGVEVIGESCFDGNDRIGRVIMSDSVREIHENAFRSCICMQTIVMSENLRTICRGAFENCKKLIRFNVPAGLAEVGFAAFRGCQSLELTQFEKGTPPAVRKEERVYGNEDIPAYSRCGDGSITELIFDKPAVIGKYAFSACPDLRTVVIDSPGCIIEEYAFEKCASLREIKVLAGKIGKGAFSFCRSLEKAEISGVTVIGDEVFAGCCSLREVLLSEEITGLGRRCFDECTSLRHFDFGNIRNVGERAFERCESLEEITLSRASAGYHAFADCTGVKRITIDKDTVLHSGVFSGCTFADTVVFDGGEYSFSEFSQSRNTADNTLPVRVQEIIGSVYSCFEVNADPGIVRYKGDAVRVRIPDDIVSAEDEAFRDHLRLTDIVFPEGFRYSGKLTFSGTGWIEAKRRESGFNIVNGMIIDAARCGETAEIPEDTERICSWAFAGNTELRELILPDELMTVDTFAFRNCINLKTIRFSDGRTYTLENYYDTEREDYPPLVARIFTECLNCFKMNGDGVLEESTGNIKALVFPGGIKEIADEVYMECNLLESIVLSQETQKIGKSAFKSSKWLRSVDNAGGVVSIGAQAFSGCRSLERTDLSDSLEYIGKRAFEHCCALRDIHISDRLTEIPERAFFRCKSLRRIVIPASVRVIGAQAFAFCTELEEVVFADPDSVQIADDAFEWCEKL